MGILLVYSSYSVRLCVALGYSALYTKYILIWFNHQKTLLTYGKGYWLTVKEVNLSYHDMGRNVNNIVHGGNLAPP